MMLVSEKMLIFAVEIIIIHDQNFNHRPRNALPAALCRQGTGLRTA